MSELIAISQAIKEKYIYLMAVERVISGYHRIAKIEDTSFEEIKKYWGKRGGIKGYVAHKLQLKHKAFEQLQRDEEVAAQLEHINKLYQNQFNDPKRREGFGDDFRRFYDWYKKYDDLGTCCYCGVHKSDLEQDQVFDNSERRRGGRLEIERVVTFPKDKNVYTPENCRLACFICNNAKSDFLSTQDFYPIARGIHTFWQKHLGKEILFPEDSEVWGMV